MPVGTKLLPEPMFTYHQSYSVALTWEWVHKKCSWTHGFGKYTFKITSTSPRGEGLHWHGHITTLLFKTGAWFHNCLRVRFCIFKGNPLVSHGFPSRKASNALMFSWFLVWASCLMDSCIARYLRCLNAHMITLMFQFYWTLNFVSYSLNSVLGMILYYYASAFRRRRHYVFGLSVRPSVRPSQAWNTLFWPVHGSVGPPDRP